jgi:3-oxoacyl-[acyl-carrier protein] reductase
MTDRLAGQVALITGATRGIGRAVARRLGSDGARVVLSYRSDDISAEATRADLMHDGIDCRLIRADITDPPQAAGLAAQAVAAFGRLDILVNNAGITHDGAFATMERQAYEQVIATNLTGTLRVTMAALPFLRQSGTGRIVMIASAAGITGKEGQVPYAASKGGIMGMTRLLARRLGAEGIRVNAVAPGFIETDMVRDLPESNYRHVLDNTSLGRMGTPEEVAGTVAFLVGPDSGYINGMTLRVDGGLQV